MAEFGNAVRDIAFSYWQIMVESSVFILFGFLVAGFLKGMIPSDFIQRHLGGKSKSGVFKAALFGVPIPL